MSQHIFRARNGNVLTLGYDRMMGEFFYSIHPFDGAEEPTHSSITDLATNMRSIDAVQLHVDPLVPEVPTGLWKEVNEDAVNDVGSRIVHWSETGQIKFDSFRVAAVA